MSKSNLTVYRILSASYICKTFNVERQTDKELLDMSNKKSKMTAEQTAAAEAKESARAAAKKRAERNKARTTKHVGKLLSLFATGVARGYEHEDWVYMSQLYKQLSPFLMLEEMEMLGMLWRSSWSGEVSHIDIHNVAGNVAERVGTQIMIDPVLSVRTATPAAATGTNSDDLLASSFTENMAGEEAATREYIVDDETDGGDDAAWG